MDTTTANESLNPARAEPDHKLLGSSSADPKTPLIICFHGSGESCEPTWSELARLLSSRYRVLLFERGPLNPKPAEATSQLLQFLKARHLPGPYILIAHSYGGAFARLFMHQAPPADIAGAVLVETGQEGGLDPKIAAAQLKRKGGVLGEKPLVVIRGNSFIAKKKALENAISEQQTASASASATEQQKAALAMQWQLLQASDVEDERMKKAQLSMSRNSRYLYIPDCGHHVIRDRPEAVSGEMEDQVR
ncbi:hypothetical protein PG988_013568 [Apiospora saccharicola]